MPELPDITIYLERLAPRIHGEPLENILIHNPFVLRSVEPSLAEAVGRNVVALERLGKRIVIGLQDDLFIVIHLMIAGRLRWRPFGKKLAGKMTMASLAFPRGTLYLTEAGTQRRASLHLVRGARL